MAFISKDVFIIPIKSIGYANSPADYISNQITIRIDPKKNVVDNQRNQRIRYSHNSKFEELQYVFFFKFYH